MRVIQSYTWLSLYNIMFKVQSSPPYSFQISCPLAGQWKCLLHKRGHLECELKTIHHRSKNLKNITEFVTKPHDLFNCVAVIPWVHFHKHISMVSVTYWSKMCPTLIDPSFGISYSCILWLSMCRDRECMRLPALVFQFGSLHSFSPWYSCWAE